MAGNGKYCEGHDKGQENYN